MVEIRPFQKSDAEQVVTTMAAAFANDALYRYFVPEDAERRAFLKAFMAFRLRYGIACGGANRFPGPDGGDDRERPGGGEARRHGRRRDDAEHASADRHAGIGCGSCL